MRGFEIMDDETIIFCINFTEKDFAKLSVQINAVKSICAECGCAIIVAPSSVKTGFRTVCLSCGSALVHAQNIAGGEPPKLTMVEGGKSEIKNFFEKLNKAHLN